LASPREITNLTHAINSQIALQTMLLHILITFTESKENKVTTYTENRPAGIGDNPTYL